MKKFLAYSFHGNYIAGMQNTKLKSPGNGSAGSTPESLDDASALQSHVGFWLRFVSNHVSGSFKKLVEAEGVSVSEWVALRQLYSAGETTHTALMEALGMTKGAVSKIVSRLQQKKLVEKLFRGEDLRAQQITLTRQGKELVPKLAALADANDDAFFGHLSSTQRNDLIEHMQEIVRLHHLRQIPVE